MRPSYGHQMNNNTGTKRKEFFVLSEIIGGKDCDAKQD